MCVDSGHTHEAESFWVPPPEEMIRILGKDVTILHLHDNNGVDDLHMPPYSCLANGRHHVCNWDSLVEGLKEIGYRQLMAQKPEFAMELAVKGMLPKNSIGEKSLTRLHAYAGSEHKQQAQKPVPYEVEM